MKIFILNIPNINKQLIQPYDLTTFCPLQIRLFIIANFMSFKSKLQRKCENEDNTFF